MDKTCESVFKHWAVCISAVIHKRRITLMNPKFNQSFFLGVCSELWPNEMTDLLS